MLTAHQCRKFTKGLFLRWKAYYPLLPTLIRLLGLQAICWPATHFTLVVLDHHVRPLICWTVIGTTTCVSRGIQIWATSNLSERRQRRRQKWGHMNGGVGENGSDGAEDDRATKEEEEREREEEKGRTRDWLRAWTRGIGSVGVGVGVEVMGPGKRWWDWKEIGLKCAVPAAVMYFVMAWGLLLSREFRSEGGGA
ncbi:uncharacterized protein EI90DRAFT_2243745 [Cantharellus anzutake]|nr:uncharacterized protein EI90DRAFT_2243745 [Cantharellus anzutake]KAF8324727.1 hypothetical protein EI90DRAFT_2243745 [Cantharellus anzutake]